MAYKRKTEDEYEILGDYGYGDGLEIVCSESSWEDARNTLKEYRENEPGLGSLSKSAG